MWRTVGVLGVTLLVAGLCGCGGCQTEPKPAVPTQGPAAAVTQAPTAGPANAETVRASTVNEVILWADGDPNIGPPPLKVQLNVEPMSDVTDPQYVWDFGDGTPEAHEQWPKHTYPKPGQYKARVKMTDAEGRYGEDEIKIDVME